MTSSNLRDLLDEATRDIPASVAHPPLSAIHRRVQRRRATLAAAGAAAAVVLMAVVAVRYYVSNAPLPPTSPAPTPTAAPSPTAWEFGFLDGPVLTVYATSLHKCTELKDPTAVAVRAGESYTVSLLGSLHTVSGCSSADPNLADHVRSAQATVRLEAAAAVHLVNDASSGQIRPIYHRAELPTGFARQEAGGVFSVGVQSVNDAAFEFHGRLQTQRSLSPPLDIVGINFRGHGLSAAPLPIIDGHQATFGSASGWLAPTADHTAYRFVWHKPRGNAWITYELYPDPGLRTKAELISLLQQLAWP